MKIIDFEHHYFSKPYYDFLLNNKDKLSKSPEFASIYSSFGFRSNNIKGIPFGDEISCKNDIDLKIMDEANMLEMILLQNSIETI